jgi:hypothetical protein
LAKSTPDTAARRTTSSSPCSRDDDLEVNQKNIEHTGWTIGQP